MQAFKLDQLVPELQPIGSVSCWRNANRRRSAGGGRYGLIANHRTPLPAVCFRPLQGSFTHDLSWFTEHATELEGVS